MDAAHKLLKNVGLLVVIALLIAAPGWSQTPALVASPSAVSLTASQGQNVQITSSVSGTPITFTVAKNYSGDASNPSGINWLSVNGGNTTPATLAFNITSTAGLAQGTHTAVVTLTPDATTGAQPLAINVTFNSGNAGGGGTLTASPNPVNLSAASGSQFTTSVQISTVSQTAIALGAPGATTTSGGNWLSASIVGNSSVIINSPITIQVTASAVGLGAGVYQGNITVTPLNSGTALTIPVNFTVGGTTGGNGTWTVTPNSIPFTYTSGGVFPSSSMVVNTTSGYTTYNVSTTSTNGWLLVAGSPSTLSGLAVGLSYTVSVGSQAASLTTGSYSGTITISDPLNVTQATINVTLTVNGGNSTGLTISPNPLSLTSLVNGPQQNPTVSVSSTVGGFLSVTGNSQSWLTIQLPANTSVAAGGQTAFSLNINPAGLSAGTYSQSLNVAVGGQAGILNVNLVVGTTGGTGSGGSVQPNTLSFTYQTGSSLNAVARQQIVIPAGNWTAAATTTSGGSWLQISSTSGISVPDQTSSPTVTVNASGLAQGSYSGNIAVTTGGAVQNIGVTLTVTASPVLVPTPGSLVFVAQTGTTPQSQSVFFSTTDFSAAPLGITATPNSSWITVTGLASTNAGSFTVSVNPTGMAAGIYSGTITVQQNGVANSPYTYPVLMIVNGGGSGSGPLGFTPSSLSFSSVNGVTSPTSTVLTVSANISTGYTYTTSVNGSVANWINISPANNGSGTTTSNISVSANPAGLSPGTYTGTISFSSNGFVQNVPVTLTVGTGSGGSTGTVSVSPTSLSFTGQLGSTSIAAQSLTVSSASGSSPVSFTVTPSTTGGGSWLTTSANTSNSTPSSLTVMVNPTNLSAGLYSGNLAIQASGGNTVNVPISLTITAPPSVAATPTSLTFTYRAGDVSPAAQTLNVTGNGLVFTATAVSNGNWLSVSPSTGTAPTTVNVSVNGSSLSAGTYSGTITIAGTNGATGSTTVNVTLTVTAPLPTITKVTNAASYAAGSISPGEIITLFAGDPTHPIGPSTAAFLTVDSSTQKVSTTLAGVQVLIGGFPAPLIYVSASQISAVVPYEVAIFPTTTVLVRFLGQSSNGVTVNVATTAPGIFTQNSSGTGPGAILNSNGSVNGPGGGATSPATRGDTVVVYMTGEGQTSPAGVTGKVTTVSSTPPLTPGPLLPISVTVGGQPANWNFAGEAPGFVTGVLQLNVQTPTNVPAGDQEILVTIGGNTSAKGVTVSLK